jgi:hypothetical protein
LVRLPILGFYGSAKVKLAPEAQILTAVAVGAGPYAQGIVCAEAVEDVLDSLIDVGGPTPLDGGDSAGVREVTEFEVNFLIAKVEAAPDLDEAVVIADTCDVRRVVGQVGGSNWASEGLLPMTGRRTRGCVIEPERGASYK